MDKRLGFIGTGNMAGAILGGILNKQMLLPSQIYLSNPTQSKLAPWSALGIFTTDDNVAVTQKADVLVLAIKPQVFDLVLPHIAPYVAGKCVVSIAAGISMAYLQKALPGALIVRAMPNTPLQVGRGATALCAAPNVPPQLFDYVGSLFAAAGEIAIIDEFHMDDIIAVSGSSPAFFFRMAQVMVREAQLAGIDGEVALRMAAKAMEGAAVMLLESGKSPAELEGQVCSPGGTTLAALSAFDDFHFDALYHEAAQRCLTRARELGR